jgi:hypothetical protein
MQRQLASAFNVTVNGGPEPVAEAVKATATAISAGLGTWVQAAADSVKYAAAHTYRGNGTDQPATSTTLHAARKHRGTPDTNVAP